MPSASISRIASSPSGIALQIAQPSPLSRTAVIRRGNLPSGIAIDPWTVRIPSATICTGPCSGMIHSSLSLGMAALPEIADGERRAERNFPPATFRSHLLEVAADDRFAVEMPAHALEPHVV